MKRLLVVCSLVLLAFCAGGASLLAAQGVAAASMNVLLTDATGAPIVGARVTAVHLSVRGRRTAGQTRGDGHLDASGDACRWPLQRVTTAAIGYLPSFEG